MRWKAVFALSWDGLQPCPLGTMATIWPMVPVPYDRLEVWRNRQNKWQRKLKYSEKN
jgi:hypothetical protein